MTCVFDEKSWKDQQFWDLSWKLLKRWEEITAEAVCQGGGFSACLPPWSVIFFKGSILYNGGIMNSTMKQRIISELDDLTDRKAYSLLDYLHFLKQEQDTNIPNKETLDSIDELESDSGKLKDYSSAAEMFDDLGIER